MLTLFGGQSESLWDEALPVEVRELPEDLAALDRLLSDPELVGPIVERFRREVVEQRRAVLTDGRPTIAMETYVRLMVLKQRYRVGVQDASGGGVGFDSLAPLLPDLAERAGAGRVDGPQAHQAVGVRDGVGADADADRGSEAGEAVQAPGGADRLDRDRGGRQVPDRRWTRFERGQVAGAGRPKALRVGQGSTGSGAGSVPLDGAEAAGDHTHDPAALRGSEGRGAEADRADRRAAGPLDRGGAQARRRGAAQGPWPRRQSEGQAERAAQRLSTAPSRSRSRSRCGCEASGSETGWSRSSIRTPGRSARASSAGPT